MPPTLRSLFPGNICHDDNCHLSKSYVNLSVTESIQPSDICHPSKVVSTLTVVGFEMKTRLEVSSAKLSRDKPKV